MRGRRGSGGWRHWTPGDSHAVTAVIYGYDALGHLTNDTRTNSYAYAKSYAVDGVGNRQSMNENGAITALTEDADDELTSCTGTGAYSYTYNANGDQITSTINGQVMMFGYDFDDRLVGIQQAGGATAAYGYDALGRQVNHTLNGAVTGYYLDGDQVLTEKNGSGVTIGQYLWGNGLVRRNGEYPLTDGQGTTKLETNASRTVTGSQETEAFGRTIGTTGSPVSPYGYHGAEGYRSDGDGPAGLEPYQKVGARYYDATFGRFIMRDTDLSQAAYAYCDGDPVNFSDPSGHHKKKGPPKPGQGNSAPPSGPGRGGPINAGSGNGTVIIISGNNNNPTINVGQGSTNVVVTGTNNTATVNGGTSSGEKGGGEGSGLFGEFLKGGIGKLGEEGAEFLIKHAGPILPIE